MQKNLIIYQLKNSLLFQVLASFLIFAIVWISVCSANHVQEKFNTIKFAQKNITIKSDHHNKKSDCQNCAEEMHCDNQITDYYLLTNIQPKQVSNEIVILKVLPNFLQFQEIPITSAQFLIKSSHFTLPKKNSLLAQKTSLLC
jgi:hypothetical protein